MCRAPAVQMQLAEGNIYVVNVSHFKYQSPDPQNEKFQNMPRNRSSNVSCQILAYRPSRFKSSAFSPVTPALLNFDLNF